MQKTKNHPSFLDNKVEIYDLYITKNLTVFEISKLKKCTIHQVRGSLYKFNIHKSKESFKNSMKRIGKDKNLRLKIEQTNLHKYNVAYPMKSKQILEKIKQNNLKKYKVSNVMQIETIKQKNKKSRLINHNGTYWTLEQEKKRQKTCLNKYGVKNPFQVPDFHKKAWKHYLYDKYLAYVF